MSLNRSKGCGLALSREPTRREIGVVQSGLAAFHREQTSGEYDQPGIEFGLALKDGVGKVVGGISVCTILRVMHLDLLWVDGFYRGLGYGRDLVLAAEAIGSRRGCIASQTMSFSFQAPGFYQKIGYDVLGVYDGYPDGITEYVLMKRLQPADRTGGGSPQPLPNRDGGLLDIVGRLGRDDLEPVHAGLRAFVHDHIGDRAKATGIRLVFSDGTGKVIGGLLGYMTLENLVIEELWLEETYRGQGLGCELVLEAERIAVKQGCTACQTYTFSFAAPGFFRKLGYESFAVSDGYPDPAEEHYLIKRFS